ncbi:MAG: hypothetical protein KBT07_09420 [Clostridiales bacterium]|nr:hypothetical protein [Candidatus Scatonaster coprocaballi]
MEIWNERLTRENIEAFYDEYASFAYRSAYRTLRDTTRAEMCVVDSFIDTYHKRAKLEEDNVIYFFSDALQFHINEMVAKYPVINDAAAPEKKLDEYTASTMKHTILERIDSPRFRIAEFVSSTPDTKMRRRTPIVEFFRGSGLTVMLLIKLAFLAIVIAVVTYFGAFTFFHANQYVQSNTQKGQMKLDAYIVSVMDYLPVSVSGVADTQNANPAASSESEPTEVTSEQTSAESTTEPSATRG